MFTGAVHALLRAGVAACLFLHALADDADLVEIRAINPRIRVELPYATPHNFTGVAVYRSTRCYLRRAVAANLSAVQEALEKHGLGLKVWDGYRPLSVQKKFWALVPDARYVASPEKGSRHNRGAAVDVTLVDRDGHELEMPTKFDDFSERASASASGHTPQALANRAVLQEVMTAHGFQIFPSEWWHFDAIGWEKFPLLDLDPASLAASPDEPAAKAHD
jgi:D-alanyl-D-alanine dipeptidase